MEVEWAETGLVLADELREGNVPVAQRIERSHAEAEVVGSNLTRRATTGD